MLKIEGIQNYNPTPSYKGRTNGRANNGQLESKISAVMSEAQACTPDKRMFTATIPSRVNDIAEMIRTGLVTKEHTDAVESKLNLLI